MGAFLCCYHFQPKSPVSAPPMRQAFGEPVAIMPPKEEILSFKGEVNLSDSVYYSCAEHKDSDFSIGSDDSPHSKTGFLNSKKSKTKSKFGDKLITSGITNIESHKKVDFFQKNTSSMLESEKVEIINEKLQSELDKVARFVAKSNVFPNKNDRSLRSWINQGEELVNRLTQSISAGIYDFELLHEGHHFENNLKIYFKTYLNPDKEKISCVYAEFYIPNCPPEYFVKFLSDIKEQKQLDPHINKFELVETILDDKINLEKLNIYYLSYKKMLIISPRDMLYMKFTKKIDEKLWCDVSKSIVDHRYPETSDKLRCEILLSGHIISSLGNGTKIKTYSENNFKSNLGDTMLKIISTKQIRSYVTKSLKRVNEMVAMSQLRY